MCCVIAVDGVECHVTQFILLVGWCSVADVGRAGLVAFEEVETAEACSFHVVLILRVVQNPCLKDRLRHALVLGDTAIRC